MLLLNGTSEFGNFASAGSVDFVGLSSLELSDFVGIGNVDTLSVIAVIPVSGFFTLNNVNSAFAQLNVNVGSGTETIEYEYSLVPEPSTAMLTGAGLLGLLGVTRRASRMRDR